MSKLVPPRDAFLCLQGWHGYTEQRVLLVGETPKRYRIRALEPTKLGGRNRWLKVGAEALVPRRALKFPSY